MFASTVRYRMCRVYVTVVYVTKSCDHTARIWDIRTGKCVMKFDGHDSDVNAVRFYPTSESIGTASNDGTVSLWVNWNLLNHICLCLVSFI